MDVLSCMGALEDAQRSRSEHAARRRATDHEDVMGWSRLSEKGEVLLRGIGTLRYLLILRVNSACQVPICAVAARWFDNEHQQLVPRSQISRSTSHFSCCPAFRFLPGESGDCRPLHAAAGGHRTITGRWGTSWTSACGVAS